MPCGAALGRRPHTQRLRPRREPPVEALEYPYQVAVLVVMMLLCFAGLRVFLKRVEIGATLWLRSASGAQAMAKATSMACEETVGQLAIAEA